MYVFPDMSTNLSTKQWTWINISDLMNTTHFIGCTKDAKCVLFVMFIMIYE